MDVESLSCDEWDLLCAAPSSVLAPQNAHGADDVTIERLHAHLMLSARSARKHSPAFTTDARQSMQRRHSVHWYGEHKAYM
jgi:hypothetical protein